jgi:signal transduction histidine kinase
VTPPGRHSPERALEKTREGTPERTFERGPTLLTPITLGASQGTPLWSSRVPSMRQRPGWPLVPLATALVILVGLAVAIAIGVVGIDQLGRSTQDHAATQAALVVDAVGARVERLPPGERDEALRMALRATGAELLVVTHDGAIVRSATLGAPDARLLRDVVAAGRGEALTARGWMHFAVHPLGSDPAGEALVAFVQAPNAAEGMPAFVTALLALTTLLIAVAAGVVHAVARDANRDVEFVTRRVAGMAHVRVEPTPEAVPVRTMDEIGLLTSAFNELLERFAVAESEYREDLGRASAADRDRATFLAAVSHELRSPLNAILGFADVLLTEVDGPLSPDARQEVEQIRASGQHLLELINDILEFSAIETGQLRLHRSKVDLSTLAQEVVREAAVVLFDKPVRLLVQGESNVLAQVDSKRVRQILTNLVGNAIKFTQAGEVVVHVQRERNYALLSVTDTGPGISPAERAVIFEEYKQAKEERRHKRGTGLGLAIARRLVLMHGGTIQVESELGRGSTFKVFLPLWRGDP